MTRLTYEQRVQCRTLYQIAGWSYNAISQRLVIPRSTVRLAISTPQTPPRPRGRLPVCRTSTRKRLIKRATIDATNRRLPFEAIAELESVNVAPNTLTKAFAKEGYYRRKARKKPLLTEKHKAARLAFALEHIDWGLDDWARVLWTDEASIKVGWFGQIYVTRTVGEELLEDCLTARFRKYSSLMIWGAISLNNVWGMWTFEEGGVDGQRYRDEILPLVNEIRLDFIVKNDGVEPIFMQDNASIHKAHATIDLLKKMDLIILNWPANSPDLNPIENIWSLLKNRIGKHFPKTREEVKAAVEKEWNLLKDTEMFDFVKSMKERLQAVIDAEGGHTRW